MQLIPFGKYKNQPVEVLQNDRPYSDFLLSQDWFRKQHENLYQLIINNFGEPSDTPEHNKLQARFLNKVFVQKVFSLCETHIANLLENNHIDYDIVFEEAGVDVSVRFFEKSSIFMHLDNIFTDDKNTLKSAIATDMIYPSNHLVDALRFVRSESTFVFELKPHISDDYPSVLRQIKRLSVREERDFGRVRAIRLGCPVVVCESFSSDAVSLTQAKQIFSASGVRLVCLSEDLCS